MKVQGKNYSLQFRFVAVEVTIIRYIGDSNARNSRHQSLSEHTGPFVPMFARRISPCLIKYLVALA